MSRKLFMSVLVLMMSAVLVLSGCNAKKEPKEALGSAAIQALKMDSYVSTNQIKIVDLTFDAGSSANAEIGAVFSMLKNAEINVNQIYQKDPMQTEATLEVKLTGDMSTTITIPFVMTKEKMFIKIPNIPFLPMPESVVGKFLVMDLKELAEQSGEEFNPEMFNPEKSQKLAGEVSSAVLAEYDSATYFKNVESKDVELPDGYKAKQIVQFSVTNDNVKEALTILINKALPKVLDIIGKEEYRTLMNLEPSDIEELKKELQEGNQDELGKALDEMKDYLKINTFTVNTAIDKDNYPSYTDMNMDVEINDPETNQKMKLALQAKSTFSKINEKPAFTIGIPTDTITMEQFEEEMGGLGY
ncbi:hypothetical protein KB559_20630 [Paenibacillus sp. Marseille-P2973]|uniref:DUF6612 family protein n=1 Tax=Paenibacillus TaxID=44249 RepID=UPI001B3869F4|nr:MULTISPECIES: DUF6612 family protein [Paenibacillus]MBQ4901253.1 hypothetical protein [Paenibacillus sp. Marseille-P2973]MDN4071355.1 hypothetical protein [Paenibacillus vini]